MCLYILLGIPFGNELKQRLFFNPYDLTYLYTTLLLHIAGCNIHTSILHRYVLCISIRVSQLPLQCEYIIDFSIIRIMLYVDIIMLIVIATYYFFRINNYQYLANISTKDVGK